MMFLRKLTNKFGGAVAAAVMVFSVELVVAGPTTSCSTEVAGKVSGSSDCLLGSVHTDFLVPLQVNEDEMFGFSDWTLAQKDDGLNGVNRTDIDVGLTFSGNDTSISGTWSLDSSVWDAFEEIMLVFKSGNGKNITPYYYLGYLLSDGVVTGSYDSPFTNLNSGGPAEISHASVYVIEGVPVPEPSILVLFALGLAAMGFSRSRKSL